MAYTIKQLPTLLYRIEASCGSTQFRRLYAEVDGTEVDILRDGQVSCAVFVSALLVMAELLPKMCATVSGLERQLQANGWQQVDTVSPGAVIIWEASAQASGEEHLHAGFALSAEEAVSHSDKGRVPEKHHYTFGVTSSGAPVRAIERVYIHRDLCQE